MEAQCMKETNIVDCCITCCTLWTGRECMLDYVTYCSSDAAILFTKTLPNLLATLHFHKIQQANFEAYMVEILTHKVA